MVSESKVYSTTSVEDDKKLYELTTRMKQQADLVKLFSQDPKVSITHSEELADTVLEFLKVSGWSRS